MNEIGFAAPAVAGSRVERASSADRRLWPALRAEAVQAAQREEMLRTLLDRAVLRHDGFAAALGALLAGKLADASLSAAASPILRNRRRPRTRRSSPPRRPTSPRSAPATPRPRAT